MLISTPFLGYSLLSFYNFAGCIMEDLVVFKAWTMTKEKAELQAMQDITGKRTGWIYVVPKMIMTIWTPFLLHEQPYLWLCIAAMAVSWGSSFLIQIPLQLKVRQTGDRASLERLANTTKIRTWAMIGHTAVVVWLLSGKI